MRYLAVASAIMCLTTLSRKAWPTRLLQMGFDLQEQACRSPSKFPLNLYGHFSWGIPSLGWSSIIPGILMYLISLFAKLKAYVYGPKRVSWKYGYEIFPSVTRLIPDIHRLNPLHLFSSLFLWPLPRRRLAYRSDGISEYMDKKPFSQNLQNLSTLERSFVRASWCTS